MNYNIEIRILDNINVIQYVSIIRAFTKDSIGGIKNKILSKDVVIYCEYNEYPDELEQVYEVIKKLENKGAQVEIRWNLKDISKIIDLSIVENIIESHKITEQEVAEDIEREFGE